MFADMPSARKALTDYFPDKSVDLLLEHLKPAITFSPREEKSEPALGATRIGGMPDLPVSVPWPLRPAAEEAKIAKIAGGHNGPHIRKHLSQATPFQFVAQIDLAEAKALGEVARDLPDEGRLLFFYDAAVGPWNDGRETCSVIYDRTPTTLLARQSVPRPLIDLHLSENYRGSPSDTVATVTEKTLSTYWGPARAMQLHGILTLPAFAATEIQNGGPHADRKLAKALEDEDFEAGYHEVFDHHVPPRNQLLGLPVPVQDDPRYDAVTIATFGEQFLSREAWLANRARIFELAGEWRLLLQIGNADYLQEPLAEGTIYFLITRQALAARAFDQVVAIYQQT